MNEAVMDTEVGLGLKSHDLRCKLRDAKVRHRNEEKELFMRKKRFLDHIFFHDTSDEITGDKLMELAQQLKQKCQINCEILHVVMNSLLGSRENIEVFIKVDGALQALLSCLSGEVGQNEKLQLLAARCVCNLALGSENSSFQVLKASDSYLFAHLSGKNIYVMEACAVALGNFAHHGKKHTHLLLSLGFFPKIPLLLMKSTDEIMASSCLYALTKVVYHGFDLLRNNDVHQAVESILLIFEKKSFSVIFLMSILSAHRSTHTVLHRYNIHIKALQHLMISINDCEKEAVYYLRVIENCFCHDSGEMAQELLKYESILEKCINLLFKTDKEHLHKECLSLLGILINHSIAAISKFGLKLLSTYSKLINGLQKKLCINKMQSLCV